MFLIQHICPKIHGVAWVSLKLTSADEVLEDGSEIILNVIPSEETEKYMVEVCTLDNQFLRYSSSCKTKIVKGNIIFRLRNKISGEVDFNGYGLSTDAEISIEYSRGVETKIEIINISYNQIQKCNQKCNLKYERNNSGNKRKIISDEEFQPEKRQKPSSEEKEIEAIIAINNLSGKSSPSSAEILSSKNQLTPGQQTAQNYKVAVLSSSTFLNSVPLSLPPQPPPQPPLQPQTSSTVLKSIPLLSQSSSQPQPQPQPSSQTSSTVSSSSKLLNSVPPQPSPQLLPQPLSESQILPQPQISFISSYIHEFIDSSDLSKLQPLLDTIFKIKIDDIQKREEKIKQEKIALRISFEQYKTKINQENAAIHVTLNEYREKLNKIANELKKEKSDFEKEKVSQQK